MRPFKSGMVHPSLLISWPFANTGVARVTRRRNVTMIQLSFFSTFDFGLPALNLELLKLFP
jgi:hypothetical protein